MEASSLILPAVLLLTALALVMSGIAIMFQIRRDRLPDATRFENIRELRAQEERLLSERRAELSIVEQKIQQRDRLIAEVAGLEERLRGLQLEHDSLDTARREIEEVKSEAADSAAELARVSQELANKRTELEQVSAECNPARIAEQKQEVERLESERSELNSVLPSLRIERANALQKIEEARTTQALVAAHQLELDRLKQQLEDLDVQRTTLEELKRDLVRIKSSRDELSDDVQRLVARKEQLEREIGRQPIDAENGKQLLEDLIKVPSCLTVPSTTRRTPRTETEALHSVSEYLKAYRLEYSRRTLFGFHTALKINDIAQITVLAGVSGTGKSLLPRRYAEAMGFHFLQIAVEPRWDSPQDLLGFYNYIEKNYRATELARVLAHMDPYTELPVNGATNSKDHLTLVLLDEMNLARVEYYFSEFLSRLEARPRFEEVDDGLKRAEARIPIDIRGLTKSVSLFPSHNVLFVGTMNDDESTQALSDKVLDRSNVLQFAAPREFQNLNGSRGVERPNEAQTFRSWRSWVRHGDSLDRSTRDLVDIAVGKLAHFMEECGRPFGHRLRDAIVAYVANYPSPGHGRADFRVPLTDQIEFRILPKLRGLEIDSHRAAFDSLDRLLRDELNDGAFAERLADLRERQAKGTGLFVWRGLTREG